MGQGDQAAHAAPEDVPQEGDGEARQEGGEGALQDEEGEAPAGVPQEPAAPEILDPAQEADLPGEGGEGDQWNPMEWDRAAEELTWERLLGLDGSLVFLEHVFWVVSLNTLFILVFAFCPYHIGHFSIAGFKLKSYINGAHFEGMLTTLCGYGIIGICLVMLHSFTKLLRFKKFSRVFGLCYVVVKWHSFSSLKSSLFQSSVDGGWTFVH